MMFRPHHVAITVSDLERARARLAVPNFHAGLKWPYP